MTREEPGVLRDRILDAAEAVVVRQGIGNLTLEAVASEAGISKGGLLHHFPTKDKLIEGMVVRCAENWRACTVESYGAVPEGPGRMARALLRHLSDAQSWTDQCQRSSSAVFAALVQNPDLIEPMRAAYAELRRRLAEDGLPPGVAETVSVTMDGLWLNRVLGLAPVDKRRMDLIRHALEALVVPGLGSPKAASPARRKGTGVRGRVGPGGSR
ncbi:MAG: TetR/AcrR family transcriptional regulator [Phycisphaeraceae bacterium]|nr:MAG: TetR/AcrR family transcriptional regulator [Phycisphaeraceae bacterium]